MRFYSTVVLLVNQRLQRKPDTVASEATKLDNNLSRKLDTKIH